MSAHFKKQIPNRLEILKENLNEAMNFITATIQDISQEDYDEFRTIFWEMLINACIHGNAKNPLKKIYIWIEILDDQRIRAVVKDQGIGFNHVDRLEMGEKNMHECGRGLSMIQSLCEAVFFNRYGNEIMIFKKVNAYEQDTVAT